MHLKLNRHHSQPLYLQLAHALREQIVCGNLPDGHKLPPERQLATTLGVNRTTVLAAYRELKAEGLACAHVGQGTVVVSPERLPMWDNSLPSAGNPPPQAGNRSPSSAGTSSPADNQAPSAGTPAPQAGNTAPPATFSLRPLMSQEAARTQNALTRDLLALTGRPDIISFAAGIPIPDLEPLPEIQSLFTELLERQGHALLHHTPTEGLPALREAIARHQSIHGVSARGQDLLVLSGSQQGLDLLARVLLDPGDLVLVEEPTFFCARQIFESRGARVAAITCDAEGLLPDQLEAWLRRTRPKFLYLIPTFHNPTGRTMSMKRRQAILALAEAYGLLLVEDDAYNGLRYEGVPVPPIKALDTKGQVVYLGSFSKLLFMGLRIGWIHAPRELLRQVAIHRQLCDIHASSISQWMVLTCLNNGLLERHRQRALVENRRRRDLMLSAMASHLQDIPNISWNRPEGGLYVWLTLPPGCAAQKVQTHANRLGVAFVPGDVFSIDGSSREALRLNFTYPAPDRVDTGIRLLGQAIRAAMQAEVTAPDSPATPLPIL